MAVSLGKGKLWAQVLMLEERLPEDMREYNINQRSEEKDMREILRGALSENGLISRGYLNTWSRVGELLGKDYAVWPSWRKCVTGGGL